MSVSREQVLKMVVDVIKDVNEELEISELEHPTEETTLYGQDGKLDSLGLVNLVSEVEDRVEDEFSVEISLADERAMAQKVPPFRSVGDLTNYIHELLTEA